MTKNNTTKRKPGRPSKYKHEFCEELIKFCEGPSYEEREIEHYDKNGNVKWVDIKRFPKPLPTLVQFARHVKVGLSTLYDWMDPKHASYQEEFSEAVTRIFKPIQKDWLIQNALQGYFNPAFAIFVAKNLTDMRDVKELESDKQVIVQITQFREEDCLPANPPQLKGLPAPDPGAEDPGDVIVIV